jgi:hypothetical protein
MLNRDRPAFGWIALAAFVAAWMLYCWVAWVQASDARARAALRAQQCPTPLQCQDEK